MSSATFNQLPAPDRAAVKAWLTGISLHYLHDTGWLEVNSREHEIAVGSRIFANLNFPDTPDRRQDFMDGATFGILSLLHAVDVEALNELLMSEGSELEKVERAA